MKKFIDGIKHGLGILFVFVVFIIGIYLVKAWSGTDGLTAGAGDILTYDKWNQLLAKILKIESSYKTTSYYYHNNNQTLLSSSLQTVDSFSFFVSGTNNVNLFITFDGSVMKLYNSSVYWCDINSSIKLDGNQIGFLYNGLSYGNLQEAYSISKTISLSNVSPGNHTINFEASSSRSGVEYCYVVNRNFSILSTPK